LRFLDYARFKSIVRDTSLASYCRFFSGLFLGVVSWMNFTSHDDFIIGQCLMSVLSDFGVDEVDGGRDTPVPLHSRNAHYE
jgi:hypothetical protein